MDVCYFLVDVQEITISPYFGVKQGDYFIPLLSKDPVLVKFLSTIRKYFCSFFDNFNIIPSWTGYKSWVNILWYAIS